MNRLLNIMPAFLSWSVIILPIALSFKYPVGVGIFIVVFSAMWFVRAMEFTFYLIYSYIKYYQNQKNDWHKKLDDFENGTNLSLYEADKRHKHILYNNFLPPSEVIHIVIIATYKEPLEVLEGSISSLLNADYDKKKVFLCLATEDRDREMAMLHAGIIEEKYGDKFGRFFHTHHPDGIKGEVRGKGGNITHAGREISKILEAEGEDFSKILITTLDADNAVHESYFSAMTHAFCLEKDRYNRSYQPLSFFFNNIWEVPIMNRLVALSSGFWHMIENGRPDRLRNFASHAQPLKALAEMDFWATNTIVEDGHQYYRSYLHFHGDYEVSPVFVPIYQDAMQGTTYFRSLKGQFLQLRRWAWGVTDVPFLIKAWWKHRSELPFLKTALKLWRLFEGHFMWATAPILITLTTPVPRLINQDFNNLNIAANSAVLIGNFFTLAFAGIAVAMSVSFLTMPPPPKKWQRISIIWQWFLLPPVTVIFGSLPALTAQTMLALGKKLEFNVTPKVRKKK